MGGGQPWEPLGSPFPQVTGKQPRAIFVPCPQFQQPTRRFRGVLFKVYNVLCTLNSCSRNRILAARARALKSKWTGSTTLALRVLGHPGDSDAGLGPEKFPILRPVISNPTAFSGALVGAERPQEKIHRAFLYLEEKYCQLN